MDGRRDREGDSRTAGAQYPSGQLGAEDDSIGLAQYGAVDFARVNFAAVNNLVPETRVPCLPFAIDSMDHLHRAVDSDIGAEIRKAFERQGLIGLAIYDAGALLLQRTQAHP